MKKSFHWVILGSLLVVLGACQQPSDGVPKAVRDAETGAPKQRQNSFDDTGKIFNVGDAETSIELTLELDPASEGAGAKQESVLNAKKQLSEATVNVSDAGVQELWVRIRVRSREPFDKRVVVLRGVLERDGQAVAGFQTVLGAFVTELAADPAAAAKEWPREFRVNVLQGVANRPASMLLYAKTEVLLAPEGAKENEIDPATVVADPSEISAKISNPLRINFPAAAAPAEAAPATAATPDGGAATL